MIKFEDLQKSKKYAKEHIVPMFFKAAYNEDGELTDKKLEDTSNIIKSCGNLIRIAKCKNCKKEYFTSWIRCKSKYCPSCSKLKSQIWCARLMPIVKKHLEEGKFIFSANFTIKDGNNLKEKLEVMKKAWRQINHENKDFKDRFASGMRSLEVKIGENSNEWHPHYHTLIFKDKYEKDYTYLKKAWLIATLRAGAIEIDDYEKAQLINDIKIAPKGEYNKLREKRGQEPIYWASVYLKGYRKKKDNTYLFDKNTDNITLLKSIIETVKYITKVPSLDEERTKEMFYSLQNIRQISTWGILYKTSAQVEKDLEEEDSKKLKDFICKCCGCTEYQLEELYESDWHDSVKDTYSLPYKS